MRAGSGVRWARASARSSRSSAIYGEWDATLTLTCRLGTPSVSRRSAMRCRACVSPARTVLLGAFSAATHTASPWGATASAAVSASSSTASIAPRPASLCIRELRRQMTEAASSIDSAPQTWAVATSPMLCPIQRSGSTPLARRSAASDTCMAHSSGCTTATSSGSSRGGASSPSPVSRPMTDHPSSSRTAASHSVRVSRNTASEASRWRPIPSHCEP